MKNVHKLIRVSSKDRTSGGKYNLKFHTNDSDIHLINSIQLKSGVIPNTQYNVNSNNNIFRFATSLNATLLYTVPVGQYNVTTYMDALKVAIDTVITPETVDITQSPLTHKLTITQSSGTFQMLGTDTNDAARVFGVEVDSPVGLTTYTASSLPNLIGLRHIFIGSSTMSNNTTLVTDDQNKFPIFADIVITVPFGATQTIDNSSNDLDFTRFGSRKNISTIDIELLDEYNRTVDLNGLDWHLVFKVQ